MLIVLVTEQKVVAKHMTQLEVALNDLFESGGPGNKLRGPAQEPDAS